MFKIYKKIGSKILGRDTKTKNRKQMAKRKKLSPEAKAKIIAGLKKVGGQVVKYGSGKPTVKVSAKKTTPTKAPTPTPEKLSFWDKTIDLKIIKPTGKQLVIGSAVTLGVGAVAYKILR